MKTTQGHMGICNRALLLITAGLMFSGSVIKGQDSGKSSTAIPDRPEKLAFPPLTYELQPRRSIASSSKAGPWHT